MLDLTTSGKTLLNKSKTMTTAKEIAEHYVCKLLKDEFLERFANDIIQYARDTIRTNRKIIRDKKVPAHVVEYLPIETDSIWPAVYANSPMDIAQRYVGSVSGWGAVYDIERDILQYARMAVAEDRLNIKTNNVLSHLVIYLPLPILQ